MNILIAIGILALFAFIAILMFVDLDRLRREAEECVCDEINTRHCPVHGQE